MQIIKKKIGVSYLFHPFHLKTSILIILFYFKIPVGYKNMTGIQADNGRKNWGGGWVC